MRRFFPYVLLFQLTVAVIARGADPGDGVLLQTLIDQALENNPRIRQFQAGWQAAEQEIPQTGAWMDPLVGVNVMSLPLRSFDFYQEPMTGKQVQVMQNIPLPGITGLKKDISEQAAFQAKDYLVDTRNNIVFQLKEAYYSLYHIEKAIEITEKNKALLQDFVRIAESKYATGQGLQQDVLKAQVELSKLLENLIVLRQKDSATQARINTLLNRDPGTLIGKLAEVTEEAFEYTVGQLQQMALGDRPLLQAADAGVRQARLSHALAKKDYWPSLNLGLEYSQRDNMDDLISGMFSISVPLFAGRKQSRKVQQTSFEVEAATAQYNDAKNEIYLEISELYSEIKQNLELLPLFGEGIIPQASQSLQSAIAGYQVNKVDFLTLLDNQLTLFNYEIDYFRVLTEYRQQISRLEWVVGQKLMVSLQ